MRRLALLLSLLVPVVAVLFAREGARRVEGWLESRPADPDRYPLVFEVERGQGASRIVADLEAQGLVSDGRAMRIYLLATGLAGKLQAGEYEVKEPLSPVELTDLLVSGRVILYAYTVPEGLDVRETARLLAGLGKWAEGNLLEAFRDASLVGDIDPAVEPVGGLEGYLFPETYHFPRDATAADVARAMVEGFRAAWLDVGGPARAAELGMTVREVATMASLVEEETALSTEHRLVSSVYHNRLRRGMRLECDPTVIHAMKRDGVWPGGELLLVQLRHDSPYNTYLYAGLPPGPISSFGKEALLAALEPEETDYLFFVASGDGGHRFASSEAEHGRNVLLWRRHQRGR